MYVEISGVSYSHFQIPVKHNDRDFTRWRQELQNFHSVVQKPCKVDQLLTSLKFIEFLRQSAKFEQLSILKRILSLLDDQDDTTRDGNLDGDDVISESPLVGEYDPDDPSDLPLFSRQIKANQLAPENLDKVRCVCGIFDDEGEKKLGENVHFLLRYACF